MQPKTSVHQNSIAGSFAVTAISSLWHAVQEMASAIYQQLQIWFDQFIYKR